MHRFKRKTEEFNYREAWESQKLSNIVILNERDEIVRAAEEVRRNAEKARNELCEMRRKIADVFAVVRSSAVVRDPDICDYLDTAAAELGIAELG